MVFGLAGQPSILDEVTRTGRNEFVLVGMETDVCVAHSAIGLMGLGFRVAVIDDATASPPPHHEYGIARVRGAGAVITSVKGIYYEWVRDLATMHATPRSAAYDVAAGPHAVGPKLVATAPTSLPYLHRQSQQAPILCRDAHLWPSDA